MNTPQPSAQHTAFMATLAGIELDIRREKRQRRAKEKIHPDWKPMTPYRRGRFDAIHANFVCPYVGCPAAEKQWRKGVSDIRSGRSCPS